MKISQKVSELLSGCDFRTKSFKWGILSAKIQEELQSLFTVHPWVCSIIALSFMKISQRVLELLSGHSFPTKFFKGM